MNENQGKNELGRIEKIKPVATNYHPCCVQPVPYCCRSKYQNYPKDTCVCKTAKSKAAMSKVPAVCRNRKPLTKQEEFIGSFVVDAVAVIIFFFFWLIQFWLTVANLSFELIKYLAHAKRQIQIAAGVLGLLLILSILGNLVLGSTASYTKPCNKSKEKAAKEAAAVVVAKQVSRENNSKKQGTCKASCKDWNFFATRSFKNPLKVIWKHDQKSGHKQSRVFKLIITNDQNIKIYETTQKIVMPDDGSHPVLVISVDPILISNY